MSLLLDALNRASRDKAAAEAPSDLLAVGAVVPAAPPLAFESQASPVPSEPLPSATKTPDWPSLEPLEFTVTLPEKPAAPRPETPAPSSVKPGPVALSLTPKVPDMAVKPASPAPAAPMPAEPPLVAASEPAPGFPGASSFAVDAGRPTKPLGGERAAQSIVRAKEMPASKNKQGVGAWVAVVLVLVLGVGLSSVFLGVGGDPMAWVQSLGLGQPSLQATGVSAPAGAPAGEAPAVSPPDLPVAAVAMAPATPTPVSRSVPSQKTPVKSAAFAPPGKDQRKLDGGSAPARTCPPGTVLPDCLPSGTDHQAGLQSRISGPSTLELGYAALTRGQLQEATKAYEQALVQNPEERDALLGLAYIAQQERRQDDALSLYKRVLRQEPDNATARTGVLTLTMLGDPQDFGSRSREVVDQNPDSAEAQSILGHALVRQERLADARLAFARALQLEPQVARHAFNLAVAFDRLHNYDEARRFYELTANLVKKPGSERSSGVALRDVLVRLEQLRSAQQAGLQ